MCIKICIGRVNIKENIVLFILLIFKIDFWLENKEILKNINVGKYWELVLGLDKC